MSMYVLEKAMEFDEITQREAVEEEWEQAKNRSLGNPDNERERGGKTFPYGNVCFRALPSEERDNLAP